jgi:beta-glucanase (GH16 family)
MLVTKPFVLAALLLCGGALAAQAAPTGSAGGKPTVTKAEPKEWEKAGWELTFHDEFDGDKLDTKKWMDSYPKDDRTHGNANGERQYYAPDGFRVEDGKLRLIAQKRPMGGRPYTSGMVTSFKSFGQKYGWFEIRAKFPKGKGMWPAFWLLPTDDSWPPEIDVLEILGHEMNKVYFTNHWRDAKGEHKSHGTSFVGPDLSADYHTFAAEWKPGEIIWYLDGVERSRSKEGVPDVPMYVLANLAVGGDWPGNPDETTPFPGYMDIDYIRVYRRAASEPARAGDAPTTKQGNNP